MLIRLEDGVTIIPSHYPRRLVIELYCGSGYSFGPIRPDCGVFSGVHSGFDGHPEEMNQRMPEILSGEDDSGLLRQFEIVAPNRSSEHQLNQYHYVAINWVDGVYVSYPVSTTISLQDVGGSWDVAIGSVRIMLADYAPWNRG